MPGFRFKSYLPCLIIAAMGLLVFGFYFSPAIYYDDWQLLVGRYYHNLTPWINPEFSRPLRETIWKLLITLFGFTPGLILFSNIIIRIASAIFLYLLYQEIQPNRREIGVAFALLTLVYPADKTRMWMVQITLGWTLGCLSAWLLYRYYRNGRAWLLLIAFLGYAYALLEYEAPLGILTAWGLMLMLYTFPPLNPPTRRISWRRWAGLTMPLVLFGLYLFYRLVWVNLIGIGGFHQIKSADLFPLIQNLVIGAQTLVYAWVEPLHALVPGLRISWLVSGALLLLAVWFLFVWRLCVYLAHHYNWLSAAPNDRRPAIRQSLYTCASGLVLCAAGYFPFITYAPPGLDFFSSRFNAYALVGAALLLVGLVDLLTLTLLRQTRQAAVMFSLFILPFIILGAGSELTIQRQTQILWQEYRQMWQGIFQAVSGLQDQTSVVLVITHTPCKPDGYSERPFLYSNMANWELSDAFNAFYSTKQISADFVYQGCDLPYQVRFRGEGYNNPPSYDGVYPYKNAVILTYDRQSRQVNLVKNIKDVIGFDVPEYQPQKLITSAPGLKTMRYLVQP